MYYYFISYEYISNKNYRQIKFIHLWKILFFIINFYFIYYFIFLISYLNNLKKKVNFQKINVSIILPVYNVECCIKKCLISLINQTLKDIEIILINDGSTDNTINIIEDFSKSDSRIKIINKNNGGVATARNLGVSFSKGKYIDFIDPDDFVELNAYEILYNLAEKYNLDMISYKLIPFTPEQESEPKLIKLKKEQIYIDSLEKYVLNISGSSVNKFYKSSLFKSKNHQFIFPSLNMGEDLIVNFHLYLYVHKYAYIDNYFYHYRLKRPGKLTYKFNKSSFRKFFNESFEYLTKLPLFYLQNNLIKGNESLILKMFFHYYNFYAKDNEMKKIFFDFLKEQIFFNEESIFKLPDKYKNFIILMNDKR